MSKYVWEQLEEPLLQPSTVTLRGANGQDLGAMGKVLVRNFIGGTKVQFIATVAKDARRCLLSGTQLRAKGYTFTLEQQRSFLTQPNNGTRVVMSREENQDTLKIVCLLKPRDAHSVTSLMLKLELENA